MLRRFAVLLSTATALAAQGELRRDDALAVIELQPRIDAAIDRGVRYLIDRQCRDGSWAYNQDVFPAGMTGLACYTLLKAGVAPEHTAVRRALTYLEGCDPQRVYAVGAILLALCEADRPQLQPQIERLARRLIEWQDGTWTYPRAPKEASHLHGDQDVSISQYAVLGLNAAARRGVKVPSKVWLDALRTGLEYQEQPAAVTLPDGTEAEIAGFRYRLASLGDRVSGGLTCAGITVLHLARQGLGPRLPMADARAVDRGLALAGAWLTHHFRIDENAAVPGFHGYYLYGLERASTYLDVAYYGSHPWYLEGARWLVDKQGGNGSWALPSLGEPDTCFAILFLARATSPKTGESARGGDIHAFEPADADLAFRGRGGQAGAPLELWVTRIGSADGLRQYAVEAVEYLVDGQVVATVAPSDPERTWSGQPFAASVALPEGDHRVSARARARLAAGNKRADQTRDLTASGFVVPVRDVWQGWMDAGARAATRNVLALGEPQAAASTGEGAHDAAAAIDGVEGTSWRWQADDPQPRLRVTLARPLPVSRVVLGIAPGTRHHAHHFDRPTRMQVLVNGAKTGPVAEIGDDPLPPVTIDLGRRTRVRQLEVVVLERAAGTGAPGVGGLTEVALER